MCVMKIIPNAKSFAHEIYRYKTSLSNYVWEVKNKFGVDPILKWEIVKRCGKYNRFSKCQSFQ